MATSKLLQRVTQLEEILAAVDYEFCELVPPQSIPDPGQIEELIIAEK
jgi:hypothetical protein